MKRTFAVIITLSFLAFGPHPAARADSPGEEDQLVSILQSDQSPHDKDVACARLKRIGTARSVPALEALLNDEQLSHSARYALESMPAPEASQALLHALPAASSPLIEVGLINSLAMRHEMAAVPSLVKLLPETNAVVAVAAAEALGKLGGSTALKALSKAAARCTGDVHDAEVDGLLTGANRELSEGNKGPAAKIFQQVYNSAANDFVRLAAFRGLALASGRREIKLITNAIAGSDEATQGAGLQLAVTLKGTAATEALMDLLPKVQVPVQISLLQCLGQRGDPTAGLAVARLMDSPDAHVRLAAITALGDLGDGSVALLLAQKAASATGAERAAARESLINLRRGPVNEVMLTLLEKQPSGTQLELIRAVGDRSDSSAVPTLLQLAQNDDDSIRAASLQALALLAGPDQVASLVQLVVSAKMDDTRSQAANALSSACQHIEAQHGHCDVEALTKAVQTAPLPARLALLPVCSGLSEAPVRDVVRSELQDSDPALRETATRTLCDTRDAQLLPDILTVAVSSSDPKFRVLAIRGCVRLMTQEDAVKMPADKKLEALKEILNTPLDLPEKRLVLSALSTIADPQALVLVAPLLNESDVESEAAQADVDIASAISSSSPAEAGAALKNVIAMPVSPAVRKSAQKALKSIQ